MRRESEAEFLARQGRESLHRSGRALVRAGQRAMHLADPRVLVDRHPFGTLAGAGTAGLLVARFAGTGRGSRVGGAVAKTAKGLAASTLALLQVRLINLLQYGALRAFNG